MAFARRFLRSNIPDSPESMDAASTLCEVSWATGILTGLGFVAACWSNPGCGGGKGCGLGSINDSVLAFVAAPSSFAAVLGRVNALSLPRCSDVSAALIFAFASSSWSCCLWTDANASELSFMTRLTISRAFRATAENAELWTRTLSRLAGFCVDGGGSNLRTFRGFSLRRSQ